MGATFLTWGRRRIANGSGVPRMRFNRVVAHRDAGSCDQFDISHRQNSSRGFAKCFLLGVLIVGVVSGRFRDLVVLGG